MKKTIVLLLALSALVFGSCSQFAGEPTVNNFTVEDSYAMPDTPPLLPQTVKNFTVEGSYTAIQVSNAIKVTVSDAVSEITITAGEYVMPNVVVKVKDNTLILKMKPMTSNRGSEIIALIPYNAGLKEVNLSGASEFHSSFTLTGDEVNIGLSGASDCFCNIEAGEVELDLSGASCFHGDVVANSAEMDLSGSSKVEGRVAVATTLDLELSGASDAIIAGNANRLEVDFSGASSLREQVVGDRYAFECTECTGSLSGSSDAFIHCDGGICVSLSGSSSLHYTGSARTSGSSTTGASSLDHEVL